MSTKHLLSKNQTTLLSSCSVCGKTKRTKAETEPPLGKPDFVTLHRATKAFDLAHAHPELVKVEEPKSEPRASSRPEAPPPPPLPLFQPSTMTSATPSKAVVEIRASSPPRQGTEIRHHGELRSARVSSGQGAGVSTTVKEALPTASVGSALVSGTTRIGER